MRHNRLIQLVAVSIAGLSLVGAGLMGAGVSDSAGRNQLMVTDQLSEGDPPEVALGIALGAFKGIFVNYLWIRANELKEAGEYHEAIELSRAITTLQPRFPRVWVFHAWNMAYNISVATQTPEERWEWVNAGVRLLRDEAIPVNPNDMLLHKELSWFFLHKIGGITDDANQYYKRALAEEWTTVLGEPPARTVETRDREGATAAYLAWIKIVAEAPDSLAQIEEPTVPALLTKLREQGIDPVSMRLLRLHARYTAALASPRRIEYTSDNEPKVQAFIELLADPEMTKAWQAFIPHARKRILVDEYHMEPWRMVAYTEKFGPLDWRHAATHSLYWSARGVEQAMSRWTARNRKDFDFVNADRVVYQSLQELYRSGDVYYSMLDDVEGRGGFYLNFPNTHFIESYGQLLQERDDVLNPDSAAWENLTPEEMANRQNLLALWWTEHGKRPYRAFAAGYENFMRDAIRTLYRRGEYARANQMLDQLIAWPGQNTNNPDRMVELGTTLDEFVVNELKDDRVLSGYVAQQEVSGSLFGAFMNGLAAGDGELFDREYQYAARVHLYYMQKQIQQTTASGDTGRTEVMPRDFREMAGNLFANLAGTLPVEIAETMYGSAPPELRVWGYDIILARFKEVVDRNAEANGTPVFDVMFPMPVGIEQHRQYITDLRRQRIEDRQETGVR